MAEKARVASANRQRQAVARKKGRKPEAHTQKESSSRLLTEDEADILYTEKHKDDKRHSLRAVIEEFGDHTAPEGGGPIISPGC